MLRYNTFAGATATVGNAENVRVPSLEDFRLAIAAVYGQTGPWEAQYQSFAHQHGCDLEAGGIMILPPSFDTRGIPPRYRDAQVRINPQVTDTVVFLRNPHGDIPAIPPTA
jgi:hypothetical protein